MIMNTYQGHMTNIHIQNLSHMLLIFALSFVKLSVTLVEILVMHS
jgi:hypothetical protein